MMRIVVLVSGGGTNLQALIDAEKRGELGGKIVGVIASKPGVYSLERAANNNIPSSVVWRKELGERYEDLLMETLESYEPDLIVLAGFLSILGQNVTDKYANRIINVHPALIPSFCGKGFYGIKVHEAALSYGVKVTGATVHFVNEIPDGGAIIFQKAVEIEPDDTAETLQKRVMEQAEWLLLPMAVRMFCEGRLKVEGNKVTIL